MFVRIVCVVFVPVRRWPELENKESFWISDPQLPNNLTRRGYFKTASARWSWWSQSLQCSIQYAVSCHRAIRDSSSWSSAISGLLGSYVTGSWRTGPLENTVRNSVLWHTSILEQFHNTAELWSSAMLQWIHPDGRGQALVPDKPQL